ncbi:ornithine cyclodeaminase family protein [Clostridium bowmanii]|nr:ornithine cyclodeaminase family protein [Clostridium bowmanii]MBU3188981.1 ornithine cyclodeaminase family protein [Clostridium bowmanii]MCA1073917.1 ornithine cyclodeaminase family protein [Clostridium bowmanii]
MLSLTKEDIINSFSMKNAIEAVKLAFSMYSSGKSTVPLRTNINVPPVQGQTLFMPAYCEVMNSLGIKIVSVFPKNVEKNKSVVSATMILLDAITGEVCCLLDGTYLTQLRTGAATGAACDLLARKGAKIGALVGTGGQASSQLEAMLTSRHLEVLKISGLNYKKTIIFAENMRKLYGHFGTNIIAVEHPNEAVVDADIITVVTSSKTPVFDGTLVKKGALISGVGSYTPFMQEIDEFTVCNANSIFVDSLDSVLVEAGDLIIPLDKGLIGKDKISGELGDVLLGKLKGRKNEEEIIIFKTVGIAIQDIITADAIYKKAVSLGIGTETKF